MGNSAKIVGSTIAPVSPPLNDQKFSGRRRCQSFHNLSIICRVFVSTSPPSHNVGIVAYRVVEEEQRIYGNIASEASCLRAR